MNDEAAGMTAAGGACRVELLGSAWLLSGQRELTIDLSGPTSLGDVIGRLAVACPALIGPIIATGCQGLAAGSVVNRNGRDFLASPTAIIQPGDRLLLVVGIGGGAGAG